MLDPFDLKNRYLDARLRHTRSRMFLLLFLERFTASSWRLLTWCALFGGLWLFQLPEMFGPAGRIGTFIIFILGLVYFIYMDLLRLGMPQQPEIDRRIESASRMRHRPLSAVDDTLANPNKSRTRMLWVEARNRIREKLDFLKTGKPHAFMAARDPYAVRLGVLIFFSLGLYVAGPAWKERLRQGLTPLRFEQATENPERLVLWITPPDYTGLAPVILKGKGGDTVTDIPAGSSMKIRVRGGSGFPHLIAGEHNIPLARAEDSNYMLEMKVPEGHELKIRQGFFTRARWLYRIVPDTPPKITMKGDVDINAEGPMRFPIEIEDDYGVKALTMTVTLNQSMNPVPLGETVHESRVVMSPPKTALGIQPVYDLTAHPWAGQPVAITLTAEDGAEQKTSLAPVMLTLPERPFNHPVAQKIITLRKKLIVQPEKDFQTLATALEDIMVRPGLYLDDKVVFLALRSAASRLFWAVPPSKEDTKSVVALLWDTALRVEGGEISIAARNLRDIQNRLESALDKPGIKQEEIQKMMGDLRAALSQYFMELQREMQKRMAEGQQVPMIPPEMLAQTIDPDTLNNFLEQLEARMAAGDQKSAQEMMAQLQRLMDMMNPSMVQPMPEDMQMMSEGIGALQEIIKKQRDLLEQTQSQYKSIESLGGINRGFGERLDEEKNFPDSWHMDDMPPPPQSPKENFSVVLNTTPHADEQEDIRHNLGDLMAQIGEKIGEVPANMGQAEQEMRRSNQALSENDPGTSIPRQEKALDYLQKAQQQLSEQLSARLQQMTGLSLMGSGMKFDPLGRPFGGNGDKNGMFFGSPVKIPDATERKKAQQILEILRRRSSELGRPEEELDYYKRLLKQF